MNLVRKMRLALGIPSEGLLGTVPTGGNECVHQGKDSGNKNETDSNLPPLKVLALLWETP